MDPDNQRKLTELKSIEEGEWGMGCHVGPFYRACL